MPIDIILYAVVALVLVFALRQVLGTRGGDERSRPNPFVNKAPDPAAPTALSVADATRMLPSNTVLPALPRSVTVVDGAATGLAAIAKADDSFDVARFAQGAQEAFVMIVEAFAGGDRATLRDLLAEPVYQAFTTVMDRRDQAGETASVEILAVRRLEIVRADLTIRIASVTIRFVADETLFVRDRDGKVIEGNADRVNEIIDIWTFVRDIAAKKQPWRVTATREEQAPEIPVADANPPVVA